jgi:hypothetical protein
MDNEETVPNGTETSIAQQLTTVVVGAIAAFAAGKLTERGVTAAFTAFRNR